MDIHRDSMATVNSPGALHALHGDPSEWREVRLHRLIVCRLGPGAAVFVRHDGRAAVHGRAMAIRAVALLRKSPSVRLAQRRLAEMAGEDVDLAPLLLALARGGLLGSIDGRTCTAAPVRWPRLLLVWAMCVLDGRRRLMRTVLRLLPPALALRIVERATMRQTSRELRRTAARLGEPTSGADEWGGSAPSHVRALASQHAQTRLLCEAPPRRVARWLTRRLLVHGWEHLEAAETRGPVLFAAMHHDAYPLLAVALLSRGRAVHAFHHAEDLARLGFAGTMERYTLQCGWPKPTFYGSADLRSVRSFVQAVRGGGLGLVFADYYDAGRRAAGADDHAARLDRYRGMTKRIVGGSTVDVAIGDGYLRLHPWTGWLAQQTGAQVLPLSIMTERDGRFTLEIRPCADHSSTHDRAEDSPAARTTRRIVAPLLDDIATAPDRWMYLSTFRSRLAVPPQGTDVR